MDRREDVQWLVPPEKIGDAIERSESKGDNFQLCCRKTSHSASDALNGEPSRLKYRDGFPQAVAFAFITDFLSRYHYVSVRRGLAALKARSLLRQMRLMEWIPRSRDPGLVRRQSGQRFRRMLGFQKYKLYQSARTGIYLDLILWLSESESRESLSQDPRSLP